jgi:S-adenosylmethionine:tRNA-ribosyltransferase-isomerase (queuine synthetase)
LTCHLQLVVLRRVYAHAVAERYRFYSCGDAILVV